MKAISIWQPHASLVISGLKPFETRAWSAWKALIGQRIWIHAGKALDDLDDMMEYLCDRANGGLIDPAWEAYRAALRQAGFQHLKDMPRGCLLGTAVLAESIPTEHLIDPGPFGNFAPGRFAWRMIDPVPLAQPIPFIGKQGFFEVPDAIGSTAACADLLEAAV